MSPVGQKEYSADATPEAKKKQQKSFVENRTRIRDGKMVSRF
jgi:hypothetical protein